jgi:hypothetical protein
MATWLDMANDAQRDAATLKSGGRLRRDADYSPSTEFTDGDVRLAFGRLLRGQEDSGRCTMSLPEIDKIIKLVDDSLHQTELGRSFDLRTERDVTREDDSWLYVGVAPHRAGVRAYEFAELLATIEQQVRTQAKKQEILLVPVRLEGTTNGTH